MDLGLGGRSGRRLGKAREGFSGQRLRVVGVVGVGVREQGKAREGYGPIRALRWVGLGLGLGVDGMCLT